MDVISLQIEGLLLLRPRRHADERGWFAETYRRDVLCAVGVDDRFIQDNQSVSARAGTVRGLHFQKPPQAQSKLVRVLSGAILDVAVDLRGSSPTFGHHVAVELDAAKGEMLYVPHGFAHGFCTLRNDTAVTYKCDAYYAPGHEGGLLWNDPALGIAWPVEAGAATVSAKDQALPRLAELPYIFP